MLVRDYAAERGKDGPVYVTINGITFAFDPAHAQAFARQVVDVARTRRPMVNPGAHIPGHGET